MLYSDVVVASLKIIKILCIFDVSLSRVVSDSDAHASLIIIPSLDVLL